MAETDPPKRRITSATIALAAAAVLALAAVGIRLFGSSERLETQPGNAAAAAAQAPSLDDSIAQLRERLRQDPDNHRDWFLLGLAQRDAGRFAEAEQAFRRAMELAPQDPDYVAYLGETLLLIHGADAPPEAERLLRRALELQPGNPQARYYLATLKDSRGDPSGAIDDLVALLREAPAGAPWEAQVREAATSIARRNSIDLADRLPPPRPAPATGATGATAAIPGPTREQMEAARSMPPSQQDAMVQDMVERLGARLRQNPRDADGWMMMMRSRMVLNQPGAARDALRSGLAAFEGDAAAQARLRAAAQELGVPAA